ncbi:MAG: hypothetical protein R3F24_05260 [Gammaproteobacteria bacterium]
MRRKAVVQAKARRGPPPEPSGRDHFDSGFDSDDDNSVDDDDSDDSLETDADIGEGISDNVGEQSIEINVENLIAELEAESHRGRKPDVHCARQKLEDYLERKRTARDLEDFDDW